MEEITNNPEDAKNSTEEKKLIKKLDELFSSAPPQQLRQSIHEIYLTYIIQNHEMLPIHFNRIATDMYFLLAFLDNIETPE